MKQNSNRREFIRTTLMASAGLSLANSRTSFYQKISTEPGKRVGLIGLDTSHVTAVTNALNNPKESDAWSGYKVVAAYSTKGSDDMKESIVIEKGLKNLFESMRG